MNARDQYFRQDSRFPSKPFPSDPATLDLHAAPPIVPRYLHETYWWAYVHPRAVRLFERQWLVNAILLGNYRRLRDAVLTELSATGAGTTLQVACVYGDFTARLIERLGPRARLDVVDVLAVQLANLRAKLGATAGVRTLQLDAAALTLPDASYDQAVLFFLLHEQPAEVRRRTLTEAWRVVKPGGRIIVCDYHRPAPWHPLRGPVAAVLRRLEPYALELWKEPLEIFLPKEAADAEIRKQTYFGGLYQSAVLQR
jgi:ubiquinone/menaquinone biosynthesis C-methylase UbiE